MNTEHVIRFVDKIQGSPEWLEFRKWKIGSSMAASIMGVGFKTPLQLFEDIMEDKETKSNEAMIRGTLMEPKARDWLNFKYQSDLKPVVVQHPNPEMEWHISSIDGFWKRPDGTIFVTEIKCPGRVDHQMALDGIVPAKYIPQLFHILEDLPGVDRILYFSYHPDSQAEIWVYRDERQMHNQFAEEHSFFSRLLSCRPPEPIEKDWITLNDPDVISKANQYSFIMDQIADLQDQAEVIKRSLITEMGDRTRAKIGFLKLQRVIRAGTIDYARIEALKGVDLAPYRKDPITTWRLS